MSTKIEWTNETWNPTTGCTKVTQGCKNCYAKRLAPKVFAGQTITVNGVTRPREFEDVLVHHDRLDMPLRWRSPKRVFVNSMSDLFHKDIPDQFITDVFGIMALAHWHTFQVLTKQPQRMVEYLSRGDHGVIAQFEALQRNGGISTKRVFSALDVKRRDGILWEWPLPNVWLGVSVEDQATADERIPLLLQTSAAVRFLSCEPLLGPINIEKFTGEGHCPNADDATHCVHWWDGAGEPCCRCRQIAPIDWVIAGGESGPKSRPSHPDWFRSLRDQCAATDVPFFFKQWGEWWPIAQMPNGYLDEENNNPKPRDSCVIQLDGRVEFDFPKGAMSCYKVGKKASGRMLDGVEHMEYPA